MTYVFDFSDPRALSPETSGGKGASLAKLTQAGFDVPVGFVISPAAYRDAAASAASLVSVFRELGHDDHEGIERASAAMQAKIRSLALSPDLCAQIALACAAHAPDTRWAVRSSGTAEDLEGAAFAGQHDTFLNCVGAAEVMRRILDCWCSLWSPRAIAYRARLGFEHSSVAMAVVVQRMCLGDVSGVAFTMNPVSGRLDEIAIDANFGLGESVVSGESEVDHIAVDKRHWTVISRHVAHKSMRIVADVQGTIEVHVDDADADRPALSDAQAIAVARLAAAVETHFGWPQDIEWAMTSSELALLQARPITAIPSRWTRDESAERFPDVVTPLTWDFVEEGFHRSLNHSFALMGLPEYGGKWFASFDNYIYGNQNAVELYARRSPVPAAPLAEMASRLPEIIQRFRWIADLPTEWHRALPTFLEEIDGFLAEPIEEYDLPRLWEYLERVNAAGTRYFLPNIAISIGHGVLHRAVRALVSSSANGDAAEALCAALVACDTTTTRVNEELRTLARRAGEEGVADRLAHTASENLWVRESSDDTPFWTGLRSFIERHGHRETDFDAYHPTWADAPWVVLDHVAALRDAPDPAVTMTDTTIRQRELEASLLEDLPEPLRPIAAQVLVLARTYTALDDLEHYHTTRLSRPLRRGVCEIGRRLRGLGIVKEERDAFFARASSLASAIAGEREMETLGEEIRRAKDSYLRARNVSPRWSVGSESREEKSNGDQLAGIPGSPGEAEGLVHIVRGAEDFAAFPRGAILVARTTNPAWTPLFYSAAAVVTESGGPLSHGAVTAREMRIPAVMSVRGVLEVLRNGDRVRVNGASGSVMLLPAA